MAYSLFASDISEDIDNCVLYCIDKYNKSIDAKFLNFNPKTKNKIL